jgi:hypothetical protein
MWMTMRAINNHVLNLKIMVHIVPNAKMANNKDIMNILNKLKSNHAKRNMVHHLWRTKTDTKQTNLLKTKRNMVSHPWRIKNGNFSTWINHTFTKPMRMSSDLNIKMGVAIPLMTKKVVDVLMTMMVIGTFFMIKMAVDVTTTTAANFNMIFLLLNMSTVGR